MPKRLQDVPCTGGDYGHLVTWKSLADSRTAPDGVCSMCGKTFNVVESEDA